VDNETVLVGQDDMSVGRNNGHAIGRVSWHEPLGEYGAVGRSQANNHVILWRDARSPPRTNLYQGLSVEVGSPCGSAMDEAYD